MEVFVEETDVRLAVGEGLVQIATRALMTRRRFAVTAREHSDGAEMTGDVQNAAHFGLIKAAHPT